MELQLAVWLKHAIVLGNLGRCENGGAETCIDCVLLHSLFVCQPLQHMLSGYAYQLCKSCMMFGRFCSSFWISPSAVLFTNQ